MMFLVAAAAVPSQVGGDQIYMKSILVHDSSLCAMKL